MRTSRPFLFSDALIVSGSDKAPFRGDLLVHHGKIAAVGPALEVPEGATVIPMEGKAISPGWVDLHTHVFPGLGVFPLEPSAIGLQTGVTTLVDAGSAGALTFENFSRHVIRPARERVLAYVNIASGGLLHGHAAEPGFVGDHFHPSLHSLALAKALAVEYPEIIGWKARLTAVLANGDASLERNALESLLTLRDETALPVMIHHIASAILPEELLSRMERRDVFTHLYHGRKGSPFHCGTGEPLEAALEARERGVLFDVGHGSGAFQWETAERACGDFGFWPDTISSDLHRYNLFWPVRDLATTLSKFLYLGASLERAIAMVTGNTLPAYSPGTRADDLLAVGAPADLTLFELEKGRFPMADAGGAERVVPERVVPLAVVRSGHLSPCYGFQMRHDLPDRFVTSLQNALSL